MTARAPRLTSALLCVLLLYVMVKTTEAVSVARPSGFVRQRRSLLTFPYGFDESYLEFIFGVGLPMDLPHPYQVLMSIEIRADYRYPVNASDFTDPTKRQEEKEKEKEEKENEKEKKKEKGDDVTKMRASGGDNENANKKLNPVNNATDIVQVVTTQGGEGYKNSTLKGQSEDKSRPGDINARANQYEIDSNQSLTSILNNDNNTTGVHISEPLQAVDIENDDATNTTTEGAWEDVDLDDSDESDARYINKRDAEDSSTRWRIYHIIEMAASNVGMDGRACLLRSICDAAATPLNHRSNGLVGELVHVLLTPSTTNDDRGRYQVNEYTSAELLGAEIGNKCRLLFPECDVSFLDLFTKFDL